MPLSVRKIQNLTVNVGPARLANSGKLTYVAVPVRTIAKPVRWAFLLFIFTLPFEAQDIGFLTGFLSPARIAGMLFFAVYFIYHHPFARSHFPPIPTAIVGFLGYIAVFAVGGVLTGGLSSILVRSITLTQLFAFLWIASDLLKNKKLTTEVLITYAVGLNILASGVIFGFFGGADEFVPGRTRVLKEDLNGLAIHLGIAVIVSVGLYFSSALERVTTKMMVATLALLPMLAIVKTGSRGGLAAFVAGLLVLIIPYGRKRWRWGPVLVGVAIMAGAGYLVATNSDFMNRWYQSYDRGSFSNREVLFPAAIEMIRERPVFGWQRDAWYHSFQLGLWDDADPHNLFLYLLLEVGLVGTVPFLVGLWLCGRCAWKSRRGDFGYLASAMLVTFFVSAMTLMTLVWKPFWFALALAVGLARCLREQNERPAPLQVQLRRALKTVPS